MPVIDCHSHVGIEYYRKEGRGNTPEHYFRDVAEPMNISNVLLMPQPSPVAERGMFPESEGNRGCVLYWKCNDYQEPVYFSQCADIVNREFRNPYDEVNQYYFNEVTSFNCENPGKVRAHFVPLLHPILDTDEYWEDVIHSYAPPAVKIHSVGSASLPADISDHKIDILREYDTPVIVHTDCKTKSVPKPLGL